MATADLLSALPVVAQDIDHSICIRAVFELLGAVARRASRSNNEAKPWGTAVHYQDSLNCRPVRGIPGSLFNHLPDSIRRILSAAPRPGTDSQPVHATICVMPKRHRVREKSFETSTRTLLYLAEEPDAGFNRLGDHLDIIRDIVARVDSLHVAEKDELLSDIWTQSDAHRKAVAELRTRAETLNYAILWKYSSRRRGVENQRTRSGFGVSEHEIANRQWELAISIRAPSSSINSLFMFDLTNRGPPSRQTDRNQLSAHRDVPGGDTTAHCIAEDTVFLDPSKPASLSFVIQSRRMSASPSPPSTPTPFMSSTPYQCDISFHEGTESHRSLQDELIAAAHLHEPRASDEIETLNEMFFRSERTMTLRTLQDELMDVAPRASGGIPFVSQDTRFVDGCSRDYSPLQDSPEYG
ncbi:hypothetical protein BV25DRAFT_1843668 [Artomyces pyxidatus]|uniref:Uncharacterized protein n=1 Tax=Artomyces pyxidatus TaxID=48021 RepID=A0ACB8SF79_9AGAM|nr:hypothetical protein BV25DRAFT_1843668 [Artomyces pyxidatus]